MGGMGCEGGICSAVIDVRVRVCRGETSEGEGEGARKEAPQSGRETVMRMRMGVGIGDYACCQGIDMSASPTRQ